GRPGRSRLVPGPPRRHLRQAGGGGTRPGPGPRADPRRPVPGLRPPDPSRAGGTGLDPGPDPRGARRLDRAFRRLRRQQPHGARPGTVHHQV
ncbi:MAG: hypothetical protein AVDCRST_MAG10-1414, partial [uncultured Acidimicrobiales bacterium]